MEVLNRFEREVLNKLGVAVRMGYDHGTATVDSGEVLVTVFREAQRTWWVYSRLGNKRFTCRAEMFAWVLKLVVL